MLHTVLKKQVDRYLLECASQGVKITLADLASKAGMTKQKLAALMTGVSRDITFEQFCILGAVMGIINTANADWANVWFSFKLPEYIKAGKLVIEIPIEQQYADLKDRSLNLMCEVFEIQMKNIQGFLKG